MQITPLKLKGAALLKPTVHKDHRGFFMESYNEQEMKKHDLPYRFVQDNRSLSVEAGVIRGLHYQLQPKAQTKLVSVVEGAIYDVIVDIRPSSSTFGQWVGVMLTAHNAYQLLVPVGFAHGFCTLVPNTQVAYKIDEYYYPEHDRGILWSDSDLGIDWPVTEPVLSEKDRISPLLRDAEYNF